MIYAKLGGSTLYHPLMYTIKIDGVTQQILDDQHIAWANFRAIARQFEQKPHTVALYDDDMLLLQKDAGRQLLDDADQATTNDVLKAALTALSIDIKQLKDLIAHSPLQLSNSRIDGWIRSADDRKFVQMHNDELIAVLQLLLLSQQNTQKTPDNILAARQRLGWTQTQLAEALGMTPTHLQVHRWESGQAEMPDKKWQQLQNFLKNI